MAEMVQRTRHDGDQYEEDNMMLWSIVRQVTHGDPAWNWVKQYAATKDGRTAYFAYKDHYLGRSFQKRNISQAETTLATSFYDGKARNYPFEIYCRALNMAFLDLEEAGEVVTEEKKVRVFLENIRAPELLMSVERVQGDPAYEESFEKAMHYLADQVNKKKQLAAKARGSTRNISAVNHEGRAGKAKGGQGKGKNGKGKVSSSFIPWKKWSKMTKEQQEAHRNKKQQEQINAKRGIAAVETVDDDDDKDATDRSAGGRMSRRS